MVREELQELFCAKIKLEYDRFKKEQLQKEPEKIFEEAYRIDCMLTIHELLKKISQELGAEELKELILLPRFLTYLYERWIRQEDSLERELSDCIRHEILKLMDTGDEIREESEEAVGEEKDEVKEEAEKAVGGAKDELKEGAEKQWADQRQRERKREGESNRPEENFEESEK